MSYMTIVFEFLSVSNRLKSLIVPSSKLVRTHVVACCCAAARFAPLFLSAQENIQPDSQIDASLSLTNSSHHWLTASIVTSHYTNLLKFVWLFQFNWWMARLVLLSSARHTKTQFISTVQKVMCSTISLPIPALVSAMILFHPAIWIVLETGWVSQRTISVSGLSSQSSGEKFMVFEHNSSFVHSSEWDMLNLGVISVKHSQDVMVPHSAHWTPGCWNHLNMTIVLMVTVLQDNWSWWFPCGVLHHLHFQQDQVGNVPVLSFCVPVFVTMIIQFGLTDRYCPHVWHKSLILRLFSCQFLQKIFETKPIRNKTVQKLYKLPLSANK